MTQKQTRSTTLVSMSPIHDLGVAAGEGNNQMGLNRKKMCLCVSSSKYSMTVFSVKFFHIFDPNDEDTSSDGNRDKLQRPQLEKKGYKLHFVRALSQTASKLNNKLEFKLKMN